ncbi:MAG: hypothetical protein WC155_08565 [Candidatus Cloacimonadales bacterium]
MNDIFTYPAVISATSVFFTLLIMGFFYLIKKRWLSLDSLLPTVTTIIEAIFANAKATNPAEAVRQEINIKIPQRDLANLSKRLATNDPIQKIYDNITEPAREAGEKDASSWIKQLASGLGASAIAGLAKGLTKKLF